MLTKTLRKFALFKQSLFLHSLMFSVPSAIAAAIIKHLDGRHNFLDRTMPVKEIFTSFTATVSLLLVFRTVKALSIYQEGARGVHQMAGSWYDAASTLISFCRTSSASCETVLNFKNTIVRLFSLLNMLCFVELEDAAELHESHAMGFNTIDIEGLDRETLLHIKNSRGKAEAVSQNIQCLIVDSITTGVLDIPAPILTRSFQDLGNGMLKFHETLYLSRSPVPITLLFATELLLLLNAVFSPFPVSFWTKEPITAAGIALVNNLIFFFLNGLASEIENPFSGDFNDIDIRRVQHDLNVRLLELLDLSVAKPARISMTRNSGQIVDAEFRSEESRMKLSMSSGSRFGRPSRRGTGSRLGMSGASLALDTYRPRRFARIDTMLMELLAASEGPEIGLREILRDSQRTDPSVKISTQTRNSSAMVGHDSTPTYKYTSHEADSQCKFISHEAESHLTPRTVDEALAVPTEAEPFTPFAEKCPATPTALGLVLRSPRRGHGNHNEKDMSACSLQPKVI